MATERKAPAPPVKTDDTATERRRPAPPSAPDPTTATERPTADEDQTPPVPVEPPEGTPRHERLA